jgi:hypothetical protein
MAFVESQTQSVGPWKAYIMALERIEARMDRICRTLEERGIPFAIVGGQAVALWVATRDPAATRTTKDVDLAVERSSLPAIEAAAMEIGMRYEEILGVGMLLEDTDPNPRHGVHLVWAGEQVRPNDESVVPSTTARIYLEPMRPVVPLANLVAMKLQANCRHDLVHLEDMIGVGLIGRQMVTELPAVLADRLRQLFDEQENRE